MSRTRRSIRVERALYGIVASVLALPVAASCASSHETPSMDAGADGAAIDAPTEAARSEEADAPAPDPCAAIELDAAVDEAGATCAHIQKLPCGLPGGATLRGCTPDPATCSASCRVDLLFGCSLTTDSCIDGGLVPDADIVLDCVVCPGGAGRRPRGLRACTVRRTRAPLGRYFARLAYLEAASVLAFRDLAGALGALDAPAGLRRAALRAASDERRHARITRRLARRFGGRTGRPRAARSTTPSLEELLVDNAVEGCVGETHGALFAIWQAARAEDAEVAQAMHRIAEDEARHATLSWRLLFWGAPRLGPDGARRVRERLGLALTSLRARSTAPAATDVMRLAGHPPPEVARALTARFEHVVLEWTEHAFARTVT